MEETDTPRPDAPPASENEREQPTPEREDSAAPAEGGETTEAFAELFASSAAAPPAQWKRGEKVRAQVVRVTEEWVFVSLGSKEEGMIRIDEFTPGSGAEEAGQPPGVPAEGQAVEAYVLSTQAGEVVLTTKLARKDASKAAIEDAWRNEIPVEGRVLQVVKGGYEVRISGLRAFCPLSQIDVRWAKEPEIHVGQTYAFRVLEYKEKGRNIILSRRALLEEERAKQREGLRDRIVAGAVVTGTVRSVQNFGAFVELGGVEALVPVSEMSWKRIESPSELIAVGQEVTAKVLSVDWDKDRISLSLKALEEDPWLGVARNYAPGQRLTGTVARLAPFGAFVTLEPGVDGLVHISALGAGRRIAHPKEVIQTGETVEVEVLSVDPSSRKISLSMEHRHTESLGSLPRVGEILAGEVEKVLEFGILVKLPSGHTGLVPNVEMGTPRGTDHSKGFRPGDAMEVVVLGVENGGRKIRLSRKAVMQKREDDELKEYSSSQAQAQAQGAASFGTLGDLLKEKFNKKG